MEYDKDDDNESKIGKELLTYLELEKNIELLQNVII